MTQQIILCVGLVVLSLFVGCSTESSQVPSQTSEQQAKKTDTPSDSFSHVIAAEVEYYTTGPQQGRPPDGKFPAGTKVNIVREAGSYILVRSQDGVEAYVSGDAIKETEP